MDQFLLCPFFEESHSFLDQFLVQLDIGSMHELPPISRYTRIKLLCVLNQPSSNKRRTWLASRLAEPSLMIKRPDTTPRRMTIAAVETNLRSESKQSFLFELSDNPVV